MKSITEHPDVQRLIIQVETLHSANAKLRQALDKYGEHTAKCREQRLYDSRCGVTAICICGLDQALKGDL